MKIIKIFSTFFIFFHISTFLVCPVIAETLNKGIIQNRNLEKESFLVAENLFNRSQYGQAIEQYKNHIKNFPGGDFVDDAIFAIGEIYRLRKNYFMAVRYYQLLENRNIKTDLYNESEYKAALCYLYSGHYKNALLKFESSYSKPHDKRREWDIVFFMAEALEKMQDNRRAFNKYLQSMQIAPDKKLKRKSKSKILKMIEKNLKLEDLTYLADRLPLKYPLDRVLLRLAVMYEKQRDYTLFQKYLTRFINDFPGHELFEKGEKKLNSFLAKSESLKTKVACVLPLSGEAAASGQKILQGIQLAFNSLSDEKRKNIELIVKDSKGDTETVATIVEDLGADNDVVCIIGPMFSKTAQIAIEKAEMFQLPMISSSASIKGLPDTSQYFFRNSLTHELQGKAIAEYAINDLELNKFVMFSSSDMHGTKLKDVFLDQVNSLGGEILAAKSYAPDQNDFKEQILDIGGLDDRELKKKALESISVESNMLLAEESKIIEYNNAGSNKDEAMSAVLVEILKQKSEISRTTPEIQGTGEAEAEALEENEIIPEEEFVNIRRDDNPEQIQGRESEDVIEEEIFFKPFLKVNYDAIFIPGFPDDVGLIAPQLAFYNIDSVQLLGGNSWNSDDVIELGGKYVKGAIFVDGFFSGSYFSRVRKFNELYEDFFGKEPDVLSAQAFDAANMVFDIVSKDRVVDRQTVKKELLEIKNYRGVSGKTTILPNGDSEKSLFFISIKNNKRIQVN